MGSYVSPYDRSARRLEAVSRRSARRRAAHEEWKRRHDDALALAILWANARLRAYRAVGVPIEGYWAPGPPKPWIGPEDSFIAAYGWLRCGRGCRTSYPHGTPVDVGWYLRGFGYRAAMARSERQRLGYKPCGHLDRLFRPPTAKIRELIKLELLAGD